MTESERFFEKTEPDAQSGCLLWVGHLTAKGYGMCRMAGRKNALPAHRRAWMLAHGDIPAGLHVLHRCDNPSCVNVDHLFLGTNQENVDDKVAKGRQPIGERAGRALLTEAQVVEIAERYSVGGITQRELAAEYGVDRSTIGHITRGDSWQVVHRPMRFGKRCARARGGVLCR